MSAVTTKQSARAAKAKPAPADLSPPHLPLLLLLFVGSGAAALIYQVVWFQMLSLIIGSSAISLGVLLATFMGGMCVGSVGLSYVVPAHRHPLRVYALLEGGIAISGLLVLLVLPWVGGLYTAIGGGGIGGFITRSLLSALCLLPPTILMGATLPAIARWVEATPRGISWLGFFYAGNIAGAVAGALLAGFHLLRVYDVTTATLVAVATNFAVAGIALLLVARSPHRTHIAAEATEPARTLAAAVPPGTWPVLVAIGLSGMAALGAEVVWTRLLSLTFGATTYTFSLILAAFLVGLGIGSGAGSFLARTTPDPRAALGWCQVLAMAGIAWAAWSIARALPFWPINVAIASSPVYIFQLDFARALWTVLPAAILWGASFPLALAAVASKQRDTGHLVGGVYAANTIGAIFGALIFALVIIGTFGTQFAQRALILTAAAGAVFMFATATGDDGRVRLSGAGSLRGGLVLVLALVLATGVAPIPGVLIAYGRYAATWIGHHGEILFTGEGTHSSMAVSRQPDGLMNYHNAGKVQASSLPQDMRLQRMLGHFTTLVPESPRSVLVIGFGAGVTAGSVSIDPRVERLTIAEIERMVPQFVGMHFGDHNERVAQNPKTRLVIDDARHFLLTTDETFDAITSDPFDPWVKGAATLYTREFFELMKRKLNPGGVVTVFVQLYEAGIEAVKSEIATFVDVFPNATIWANTHQGTGYDVVLMGQAEPTRIDLDRWDLRLNAPEYADVRRSLSEIGIHAVDDLLATFVGRGPELQPWLADAQINRDRNLRLQYLAGLGANRYEQDIIHQQMLAHMRFPHDLFAGAPERIDYLRMRVEGGW